METTSPLAPDLKQKIDQARTVLDAVSNTVDSSHHDDFAPVAKRLDDWAAKVAVIGQVKAGKSTFLNAFLGQHDYLPSDINPWTSVVTNLRYNIESDPETGVSFEFFSEEDWNEIIEGKSAISDLSEELLPGFDADLLREQSKQLRDKAQRRLGNHYKSMLGTSHDFNFSSPDLLRRYVCAGPGSDHGLTDESLGRYASLTREASVYARDESFAVPTILTDTPGVNDPFLVRDEVTYRALDRSDVFIMVLSVHQPLTDVDLALIRLLAQKNDRDVLILINRLDELHDYDARYNELVQDVSMRLAEAIPDTKFEIILTSGFMADAVLREDEEGEALQEELDTPNLAAYLRDSYGTVPKERGDRLMLASGVSRVRKALSNMIDTGVASRQIEQIRKDISAQIAATKYSADNTIASIGNDIEQFQKSDAASFTKQVEDEIAALEKTQKSVFDMLSNGKSQLETSVSTSEADLEVALNDAIEEFLDSQEMLIQNSLTLDENQEVPDEPITIFLGTLHRKFEETVSMQFEASRARVDTKLEAIASFANDRLSETFKGDFQDVSLENLPYETFSTTLTMAKRSIEINLVGKRSLAFWKKKSVNMDKSIQVVKKLAKEELRHAVKLLFASFREALDARISGGIERIKLIERVIGRGVEDRKSRLEKHHARIGEGGDNPSVTVQALQSQADELTAMCVALSEIENTLLTDTSKNEAA